MEGRRQRTGGDGGGNVDARPTADQAETRPEDHADDHRDRGRGQRERGRQRAGVVAAVQLGPAAGPGIRDDQGEAVRTERGRRRPQQSVVASQRIRAGERSIPVRVRLSHRSFSPLPSPRTNEVGYSGYSYPRQPRVPILYPHSVRSRTSLLRTT